MVDVVMPEFGKVKGMEIKQVHERKDGVKYLLLSKRGEFKEGDYVKIIKLEEGKYG